MVPQLRSSYMGTQRTAGFRPPLHCSGPLKLARVVSSYEKLPTRRAAGAGGRHLWLWIKFGIITPCAWWTHSCAHQWATAN